MQDINKKDFNSFKTEVDAWIKQIRKEFSEINYTSKLTEENTDNIQHNYELITELRDEIGLLKQQLGALKLIEIILLKNKLKKQN